MAHIVHGVAGLLSKSACPAGQAVQLVDDSGENVPIAHTLHAVAALRSKSAVPMAHGVQLDCAVLELSKVPVQFGQPYAYVETLAKCFRVR